MCFQLRDALRVGNIFLSDQFFSVLMEEREAIKQIRDELCRFAIVTEPAKTLFGKVRASPRSALASACMCLPTNRARRHQVRKTYTGKLGGMQDDLAITLQLAITGLRCFYQVRHAKAYCLRARPHNNRRSCVFAVR